MNFFKNNGKAWQLIDSGTTLVWLRRDLRIADNAALFYALRENHKVLPLFIFDTNILTNLEDRDDARVSFIIDSLNILNDELTKIGSTLITAYGKPEEIFRELDVKAVYTNHDYEPYARKRDSTISGILASRGIAFKTFKDQVIFEKDEIVKEDGKPYTVFTPYSKKWKEKLEPFYTRTYPVERFFQNLKKVNRLSVPAHDDIGFRKSLVDFPKRTIPAEVISKYDTARDFPALKGTSGLSVHLRFGTVSIRELVNLALQKNEIWLNELIWREFYQMVLWHFPKVENAFKSVYDSIHWRNEPSEFDAWCHGLTGYPIVDAGMRELNTTGFMHNRVRMIVASFLTKHLLIDWRWGEAYFARKLLDFDLASNNGNWQWAAGSGCDAAPYFRIFNPYLQTQKFDPELRYVKKWVPELGTDLYPLPIVSHEFARKRALNAYKSALAP